MCGCFWKARSDWTVNSVAMIVVIRENYYTDVKYVFKDCVHLALAICQGWQDRVPGHTMIRDSMFTMFTFTSPIDNSYTLIVISSIVDRRTSIIR